MTLQDALVAYRTYARAEGKSPKTIDWVARAVGYFADFLGPEPPEIGAITGDDLRRFVIALKDRPKFANHPYNRQKKEKVSLVSIDTYCRGIRSFFSFLKRENFVEENVMEKVKTPKIPETVTPTFSEKELVRLLAQVNKTTDEGFRDYCIIMTFIDTGIRLSELLDLKVDDVDFEQNYFKVMGKGRKERFVPFGRKVAKLLMKYQMKHRPEPLGTDHFWLRRDGQPLSTKRVQKVLRVYGRKAGFKRCYPHKLRHTSAVTYLRNGGDIFSLQKKLGHRSLVMTRHYSNLADSDVRSQHMKYGVADRLNI
jgi:integrase/recombinase XerD